MKLNRLRTLFAIERFMLEVGAAPAAEDAPSMELCEDVTIGRCGGRSCGERKCVDGSTIIILVIILALYLATKKVLHLLRIAEPLTAATPPLPLSKDGVCFRCAADLPEDVDVILFPQ